MFKVKRNFEPNMPDIRGPIRGKMGLIARERE
jgi:hypothetical protein